MFSLPVFRTSIETLTSCPGQASTEYTYKLENLSAAGAVEGGGVGVGEGEGEGIGVGEGVGDNSIDLLS